MKFFSQPQKRLDICMGDGSKMQHEQSEMEVGKGPINVQRRIYNLNKEP
jgi:hypothetical protein